jgi:hypothetical protein
VGSDSLWNPVSTEQNTLNNLTRVPLDTGNLQGFFRLHAPYPGTAEPIEAIGWNKDVVLENSSAPKAEAFGVGGEAWFEHGLDGFADGLAVSREYRSLIDPTVLFRLQPYDANNTLLLTPDASTNTLVLKTPVSLSKLYILSAYAFSELKPTKVILHYIDGTTSDAKPFTSHEWFAATANGKPVPTVFPGVGRSATSKEFVYSRFSNGFSLFQTEIPLNEGPNAGKAITQLEFIRPDSEMLHVGIFAISGVRIPTRP